MDVSENSGTPKSSTLIGFSILGYPYFWKHPYELLWCELPYDCHVRPHKHCMIRIEAKILKIKELPPEEAVGRLSEAVPQFLLCLWHGMLAKKIILLCVNKLNTSCRHRFSSLKARYPSWHMWALVCLYRYVSVLGCYCRAPPGWINLLIRWGMLQWSVATCRYRYSGGARREKGWKGSL